MIVLSKVPPHCYNNRGRGQQRNLAIMTIVSKICSGCKKSLPLSEFYKRHGQTDLLNPSQYAGECKTCVKARNYNPKSTTKQVSYVTSEQWGIKYLHSKGIPALPGKALSYAWVDIIAFGCVRVEVKYSTLLEGEHFKFTLTPGQKKRGLLGDVVMLICDYGTRTTSHLFLPSFPAFYINGKLKTGFHFTPGALKALKFGATRVVMTQPMMDNAQDNIRLIYDQLYKHCEDLKRVSLLEAA